MIIVGELIRKTAMVRILLYSVAQLHVQMKWPGVSSLLTIFQTILTSANLQVTAKHNFTHVLQSERRETHVLVTHGIYRHDLIALHSIWEPPG